MAIKNKLLDIESKYEQMEN